jgi:hypothetical protein
MIFSGFEPILFHKLVTSVPVRFAIQSDFGIMLDSTGTKVTDWQSLSNPSGSFIIRNTSSIEQPAFNSIGLNGFPTVTFDGVNDNLRVDTALGASKFFSWTSTSILPCYVFSVFKQITWVSTARPYVAGQSGFPAQVGTTPQLKQSLLASQNTNAGAALGTWVRSEDYNNGANSFFKLGSTLASGGNPGTLANTFGLSLGANFAPGSNNVLLTPCNIAFAAMIICAGLPTVAERLALSSAVQRKYGNVALT